jgi:X-X-X-Leu-X-X-Gly heptad repeat protein
VQAGIERAVTMNDGLPPTYFVYTVTDYDLIADGDGIPQRDERSRPYVTAKQFEPTILPLFLEGAVHALKIQPDVASARHLYTHVQESDLFDRKLKMYKVNASLADQSHEIGRARAFTPGWLENESIWLHMEYKYLLEVLKAGLYKEFLEDFEHVLIPFQDPEIYGRSPLENSSFIVSSAHADESLHGAGFVARLSGSTAEFLNIWSVMMAGERPFFVRDGELCLAFKPVLPGWLFTPDGQVTFKFLGNCTVTYHNPHRMDTFEGGMRPQRIVLRTKDDRPARLSDGIIELSDGIIELSDGIIELSDGIIELSDGIIGAPYAGMMRDGQIESVHVFFEIPQ